MIAARLPSNIIPCRPAHLVYLCEDMRAAERAQFVAITGAPAYNPDTAAHCFVNTWARSGAFSVTAVRANGLPAAAGGFEQVAPGEWQSWMLGTEEGWAEQWRSLTKASRWLLDRLFDAGAQRVRTIALTDRCKALEWFARSLGMAPDGAAGDGITSFSIQRGTHGRSE